MKENSKKRLVRRAGGAALALYRFFILAGFSVIDICVLPICVTLFRSLSSGRGGAIITGAGTNDPKSPTCAVGIG